MAESDTSQFCKLFANSFVPNVCRCTNICFACFGCFSCRFMYACCCRSNCNPNDTTVKLRQTEKNERINACIRVFFRSSHHFNDDVFDSKCTLQNFIHQIGPSSDGFMKQGFLFEIPELEQRDRCNSIVTCNQRKSL